MKKQAMSDYLLEQYKLLSSSFNDEISRFWSRFNILVGLEMGGFVGVLASSKVLIANPILFRIALAFMSFYSLASLAIVWRGFLMHQTILKVLVLLERESEGELRILKLSGQVSRTPIGLNQVIAIVISLAFAILWLYFLIYAESIGYQFAVP